jgi:hypothetical protein
MWKVISRASFQRSSSTHFGALSAFKIRTTRRSSYMVKRKDRLREKSKGLSRHSQRFVKAAKEQVQDALEEGADAFKQTKKAEA